MLSRRMRPLASNASSAAAGSYPLPPRAALCDGERAAGAAGSTSSCGASSSGTSPSSGSASGSGSSPCEGALVARNVATSMMSRPKNTCARRNLRPTSRQLRNSRLTSSGSASVTTSKSFGSSPSIRSRTQPPTRNAWKPPSRRRYSTRSALGEMPEREIACAARGMIRAVAAGVATDASGGFKFLGFRLEQSGWLSIIPRSCPRPRSRSLRLEAQDIALSRL